MSVTDLSDAFDLLERKVQQAETNQPTTDTTGTVSDDQFGSDKVQQMIDKANAAIRSEFDQANFEQSEKISQLDRKFSERYNFDWFTFQEFRYRQIDHFATEQTELKKNTNLMKASLERVASRIQILESRESSGMLENNTVVYAVGSWLS